GAGDVKQLSAFIAATSRMKLQERKGPSGEVILAPEKGLFAIAFVADEFLFVVDHEGEKPLELLDEVLAVKAGKKKSFADGPLGKVLEPTPGAARMAFVVQVPEQTRKDITTEKGSPLRVFPQRIVAYSVKEEKMTLTVQGTLDKKEEAGPFRDALLELRQKGLKGLDNAPAEVPKELVKRLKETLEGIKVEADGATVKGRLAVDSDALMQTIELLFKQRSIAPPPPP